MNIPKQIPKTAFGRIYVDIHDQIDWNAGDFGDKHSCLWGENIRQKNMLNSMDDLRILRVYNSDDTGFGRALLLRDDWNPDVYVLFNTFPAENTLMYLDVYGTLLKYILKTNGILIETNRAVISRSESRPQYMYTNHTTGLAVYPASSDSVPYVQLFENCKE